MSTCDFTVDILFFFQTTVGILGNCSLLCCNVFLSFSGGNFRSNFLITRHLTIASFMVILSKAIPQTLSFFGCKNFLNYSGCKFFAYAHRVGRGMSIGNTCLLSVYQATVISPGTPKGACWKINAPKYIRFSIFFGWILHMLLNVIYLVFVTSEWTNTTVVGGKEVYCAFAPLDQTAGMVYAALLTLPDAVCLALMLWASGFTVFILYRHKKRVQHIRRNVSPRASPETRATQTILALVSTFLSFYTVSSIFTIILRLYDHSTQLLVNIAGLSAAFYPTLSPYLLLRCDCRVSSLSVTCVR